MANFEERFDKEFIYKTKPVGAKNEAKFFKSEATPNRVKSFIKSELNNLLDRVEEVIGEDVWIPTGEKVGNKYKVITTGRAFVENNLREKQRTALKKIRKSI
jgi:hypothetical protein